MNIELKIKEKKENNEYILKDIKTSKEYSVIMEFYDIDSPKKGDILIISEKLLDLNYEGYCQPYAFTLFKNDINNLNKNDIIGLITSKEKFVLKRIYG